MRMLYAAFAVACLFCVNPAIAQTDGSVPLTSIFSAAQPYIVDLVGVLVAAFLAWLTSWLHTRFNVDLDAAHRDTLETALKNAAGLVVQKAGSTLDGKSIQLGSPLLAEGVVYIMQHAGDAIEHFGLTPDALAKKLLAKLGLPVEAGPIMGLAELAAPITPAGSPAAAA
jgi:hypothetical protein